MNAGATRGVSVDASAGVKIDWVIWVGIGFAIVGLVLLVGGITLIVKIARRARGESAAPAP
jgi:hypothetical protein